MHKEKRDDSLDKNSLLKKITLLLLVMMIVAACFAGCGTISTEKAADYLDEEDTSGTGSGGECTIKIECITVTENMELLDEAKQGIIPEDGIILDTTTVPFDEGDTVLDILQTVTKENNIHMEYEDSPAYDGGYVEGIANLYEFDCGDLSGWDYFVNGWLPNYGCGNYIVGDGDVIEWRYTCDSGNDLD